MNWMDILRAQYGGPPQPNVRQSPGGIPFYEQQMGMGEPMSGAWATPGWPQNSSEYPKTAPSVMPKPVFDALRQAETGSELVDQAMQEGRWGRAGLGYGNRPWSHLWLEGI